MESVQISPCSFVANARKVDVSEFRVKHYVVSRYPGEGGGGYSHTLPIRVSAAQRGRDFEAPNL